MRSKLAITSILFATMSCGDQPALSRLKPEPQAPARLTPEIQAQLAPYFDVSAAQEYFRTMPQAQADSILIGMGFRTGGPPENTEGVQIPIRSSNAETQRSLDRMWAPYWQLLPTDVTQSSNLPYPGREMVKSEQPIDHGETIP